MESHMILLVTSILPVCNKESLQEERAWKEHAGEGNIRQKGATVAGGVSQTGANTPTRGVHDRHKGDSRTVRTALAQGLTHNRVSHAEPRRRRRRSSGHHTVSNRAFRPFFSHLASFFHPPPSFGLRLPSRWSCTRHLPGAP